MHVPIFGPKWTILNKSWQRHPTRHQLYGHLPPITKSIQVRRARHAGHCWRSRDELIRDVLLWIPTHGRARAGRPARTYIQQLCEDTGCCPEDLPRAMNDREEWRERVRDIRAASTIWWWWWYIYSPYTYRYEYVCKDCYFFTKEILLNNVKITCGIAGGFSSCRTLPEKQGRVMYSYGPPHMAGQKQDEQLEHTFSSYVRIQDVALKTDQRRWTIGGSGERGSGISVLAAQHDVDDVFENYELSSRLLYISDIQEAKGRVRKQDGRTWARDLDTEGGRNE